MKDTLQRTWEPATDASEIRGPDTHVWRIPLNGAYNTDRHLAVLSHDEQTRVGRFYQAKHSARYAIAHSALRQILSHYTTTSARDLEFAVGEHGKPELQNGRSPSGHMVHFNLSHSSDMALVAVSLHGAVGVDVERWREHMEHLDIAERFFSPFERDALRSASEDTQSSDALVRGFFSTWSRKEAYLKATGHGISRGLHHFDVTMARTPDDQEARLLADRLDPTAVERWMMHNIQVAPGYSAALVVTAPPPGSEPGAVRLFDSPYM